MAWDSIPLSRVFALGRYLYQSANLRTHRRELIHGERDPNKRRVQMLGPLMPLLTPLTVVGALEINRCGEIRPRGRYFTMAATLSLLMAML